MTRGFASVEELLASAAPVKYPSSEILLALSGRDSLTSLVSSAIVSGVVFSPRNGASAASVSISSPEVPTGSLVEALLSCSCGVISSVDPSVLSVLVSITLGLSAIGSSPPSKSSGKGRAQTISPGASSSRSNCSRVLSCSPG